MLQFFDDLPDDRWAAFVYVERHAREKYLSGPQSVEKRRRYVEMTLVAAYELGLRIFPEWQHEPGKLYDLAGLGFQFDEDGKFKAFKRDLAVVMPKIKSLAKRGTALRKHGMATRPLDLPQER